MRHALPVLYCVDEDTREKLLLMMTGDVPEPKWTEWYPDIIAIAEGDMTHFVFPDDLDYAKEMRQRPRPKRVT